MAIWAALETSKSVDPGEEEAGERERERDSTETRTAVAGACTACAMAGTVGCWVRECADAACHARVFVFLELVLVPYCRPQLLLPETAHQEVET